ncbi:transposase, partial [Limnospira fusiformis CCALA 023]
MRINLLPDMSNPRKRSKSLESMKEHSADGT